MNTSWRYLENLSRAVLYVLKALWRHLCKTYWRCLEDVFKTSQRRLEGVLKTSWRRLEDVLKTFLQDVLKTSWKRLEDVLKTYGQDEYIGLDQDVLKTSSEDVRLRRTYSSWSRRLEDVFWRRRQKTSSRRLHQDECLLGYLLNYSIKANLYIVLVWFLGPHSCIFDKLSGEVSDLKLSKNVKVMFIFNTKLFY